MEKESVYGYSSILLALIIAMFNIIIIPTSRLVEINFFGFIIGMILGIVQTFKKNKTIGIIGFIINLLFSMIFNPIIF